MGRISQCLMVLFLFQTISMLMAEEQVDVPNPHEDDELPLIATYEEREDEIDVVKRYCPESMIGKPPFPYAGFKSCVCRMNLMNFQGTLSCTNNVSRKKRSQDEQEMENDRLGYLNENVEVKRDPMDTETDEDLETLDFFEELEKRGKGGKGGKGKCKKPTPKNNRSVRQLNLDYLAWHNYYRCVHDTGRVTYSVALERAAKRNVEMNVAGGGMVHSSNSPYGENLWAMWGRGYGLRAVTGQDPVKAWYDEMKNPGYNFNRPTMFSYGTGHFTQVVWKDTKKIGCWTAEHPYQGKTRVFTACEYDPPGNMNIRPKTKNVQNWKTNVPPPKY